MCNYSGCHTKADLNPAIAQPFYYCASCRLKRKKQKAAEYRRNKPKYIAQGSAFYADTKIQFLKMYGGRCQCCWHNVTEHLAIDHVDGGGKQDRRQRSVIVILQDAISTYQPDKYRILCHNCNAAVGIYGECPHQNPGVLSVFESKRLSYNGQRYGQWRQKVLDVYGRTCRRCGTADEWCLTLDHINGGGRKHRAERQLIGICIDAVRENDHSKYQTLCWNCNVAKR